MPRRNSIFRSSRLFLLTAALLGVGILVGCADSDTVTTPNENGNYGYANYRNDGTINNTTDPGSIRAEDRGIPQSATTGKRDEGLGWGVSGGDR